jgi:uncharacterized coiled-coil protein SlyX
MIDASLLAQGQPLATVDDVVYQAVRLVFACHVDEAPALYCSLDDWPSSHAARLAAKDREIAELAALADRQAQQVLKLSQRLATLEERLKDTPAQNQEAMFRAQAAYVNDAPPDPPADPLVCPDCDKAGWKSAKALQMHRQRAHEGMVAVRSPTSPPIQYVEDLGWRCAAKGCAGAHARDLHDPAFCTLHAQRQITNGLEVAA